MEAIANDFRLALSMGRPPRTKVKLKAATVATVVVPPSSNEGNLVSAAATRANEK